MTGAWKPGGAAAALEGALTAVLGSDDPPVSRRTLKVVGSPRAQRRVEAVALRSGRRLIVKLRNDRAVCREALFYAHLLAPRGAPTPAYLGQARTQEGWLALVIEEIPGRPASTEPGDVQQAMAALARVHAAFEGTSVAEVLGRSAPDALRREAQPDPIDREALMAAIATPGTHTGGRDEERLWDVADRLAAEPLVLDPGDVRPENFIFARDRVYLIDFENAALRRRALALAAMLPNWPDPELVLTAYRVAAAVCSRFPLDAGALHAARWWLSAAHRPGEERPREEGPT
ncbi:MAG TPA: phosphotransferase [Limnochordia bacterium]